MQSVGSGIGSSVERPTDLATALAPAEFGYYFVIFYTIFGARLGLILTGGIGSGFLLIPVLSLCFIALGPSVMTVVRTVWIPLACGVSYLFIQLAVHGEPLYAPYVYQFGPWLISLIIVQALAMHRPNFLHRFAWFTLLMGLAMLPFMSFGQTRAYERIGLAEDLGYANPNAMAGWFGFCALYLTIRGYIEARPVYRVGAWLMAVISLYIVTLTVSRAALLAVVGSLGIMSRRLLKVGLMPVILLAGLLFGLTEVGIFDQAIRSYGIRGAEETGRFLVWPLLVERFLDSPFVGNGASSAGAVLPTGKFVTPHNSFLLFAVASGIVPLFLFCGYCWQSGMLAVRANLEDRDSMFYLPLVVYTVLITSAGNMDFMTPWAVVSLAFPLRFIQEHVDEEKLERVRAFADVREVNEN